MNRVIIWLRSNPAQTIDTTRKEHQAGKTRMKINNTDMFNTSMLEAIRQPNPVTKSLALMVLGFFLSTFYAPSAKAIQLGVEHDKRQSAIQASLDTKSSGLKYTELLKEMKGQFKEAQYLYEQQFDNTFALKADLQSALKGGSLIVKKDDWRKALNKAIALRKEASQYHEDILKSFEADENWAKNANLSEEIIQRQQEGYTTFQERYDTFNELADALETAPEGEEQIDALNALNEKLGEWQFGRKHQYYDKEQMGSSTPKSAAGAPLLLSKADYLEKDLLSNPVVQFAANDGFVFDAVPQANDPAYLAETDEVVLTQAIIDKAAELEYKPVEIYNWVRNNIEWIPGWGSYQTAQMTMEVGRGNAMDISSLLIALLRASNIPARYVSGIVEIPEDKYNNWLGNFANADVAIDYGVKAGISTTAVTSGGKITKVRMQHLWVEAAVDYFPSRGAKNRDADSWVSLDASFKQYEYQEGLDVIAISGIDANTLSQQLIDSGTVNETDGFVQNLDPRAIQQSQENAQIVIENYINTQTTDLTAADVIGGRRTIIKEYPILAAGLPYKLMSKGEEYGFLPNGLQHRVGLGFGNNGSNNLVFFPMAKLNNAKISLSFKPASEADENALTALLPTGNITDANQLPSFIPNSINVTPELTLNGEAFTTASALGVGNEIDMVYQVISPVATYAPYRYSVIAGSYLNIPIVGQSISPEGLTQSQTKLESTRTTIESQDQAQISLLSRDDILGDMYYVGGLGYHAQLISLNYLSSLKQKGAHQLAYGYGSYGYEPNLNTFFGITRGVDKGGIAFNMRHAAVVHSQTGLQQENANMMFQNGLVSSMLEHQIPEQMFADPDNPIDAVSAMKALQLAVQQGQRIYEFDRNNVGSLSAISIDADARVEIVASINLGNKVIVHQSPIQVPGWRGSGYILLDEETGVGSYKISGGTNGGFGDFADDSDGLLSLSLDVILNTLIEAILILADALFKVGLFSAANAVLSLAVNLTKLLDCKDEFTKNFARVFITVSILATLVLSTLVLASGFGFGLLIAVAAISAVQSINVNLFTDAVINSDDCKS